MTNAKQDSLWEEIETLITRRLEKIKSVNKREQLRSELLDEVVIYVAHRLQPDNLAHALYHVYADATVYILDDSEFHTKKMESSYAKVKLWVQTLIAMNEIFSNIDDGISDQLEVMRKDLKHFERLNKGETDGGQRAENWKLFQYLQHQKKMMDAQDMLNTLDTTAPQTKTH